MAQYATPSSVPSRTLQPRGYLAAAKRSAFTLSSDSDPTFESMEASANAAFESDRAANDAAFESSKAEMSASFRRSPAVIAGIVIGSLVGAIVLGTAVFLFCYWRRKRAQRAADQEHRDAYSRPSIPVSVPVSSQFVAGTQAKDVFKSPTELHDADYRPELNGGHGRVEAEEELVMGELRGAPPLLVDEMAIDKHELRSGNR